MRPSFVPVRKTRSIEARGYLLRFQMFRITSALFSSFIVFFQIKRHAELDRRCFVNHHWTHAALLKYDISLAVMRLP